MAKKPKADERPPLRFVLSSEQCELHLAFEAASSLAEVARAVGRESSVVSRQLKRTAETAQVLEKRQGRWWMTPLGAQICEATRGAIATQQRLLQQQHRLTLSDASVSGTMPSFDRPTTLLLVGCQRGFDDPAWGRRSNPEAEANIARLLACWRRARMPVVHARLESREPRSPLRAGTPGAAFKPEAEPLADEIVVTRSGNSAFVGTGLEQILKDRGCGTLVVVGFTANQCVDTSVRYASESGFRVYVVADAVATFERVAPDGRLLSGDELQSATLASLNQEFAAVVATASILRQSEP